MLCDEIRKLHPRPSPPFSHRDVDELEERIGCELPDSYREMIRTFGGCSFELSTYYSDPKSKLPVMFGWFFGPEELRDALDSRMESIPDRMIPIGEDGGGNMYCLGISGNDRDKVFFHDHNVGWEADAEKYLEQGQPIPPSLRYQTVYLLATSFREFVCSMYIDE